MLRTSVFSIDIRGTYIQFLFGLCPFVMVAPLFYCSIFHFLVNIDIHSCVKQKYQSVKSNRFSFFKLNLFSATVLIKRVFFVCFFKKLSCGWIKPVVLPWFGSKCEPFHQHSAVTASFIRHSSSSRRLKDTFPGLRLLNVEHIIQDFTVLPVFKG